MYVKVVLKYSTKQSKFTFHYCISEINGEATDNSFNWLCVLVSVSQPITWRAGLQFPNDE